jgi:hypothetical protein
MLLYRYTAGGICFRRRWRWNSDRGRYANGMHLDRCQQYKLAFHYVRRNWKRSWFRRVQRVREYRRCTDGIVDGRGSNRDGFTGLLLQSESNDHRPPRERIHWYIGHGDNRADVCVDGRQQRVLDLHYFGTRRH